MLQPLHRIAKSSLSDAEHRHVPIKGRRQRTAHTSTLRAFDQRSVRTPVTNPGAHRMVGIRPR
jgi:hypothetical protein